MIKTLSSALPLLASLSPSLTSRADLRLQSSTRKREQGSDDEEEEGDEEGSLTNAKI
jgi:hypothetical protein